MSLPNPNKPVTEERLAQFYQGIYPYLGGQTGGDVPIGSIISLMGTTVPYGYLECNGQTVNISEYTALANFFETEFGSKNYFGGDGTTTIGVPDLRGEFLRGTGTNSHTDQGSGEAKAGDHQDATEIRYNAWTTDQNLIYFRGNGIYEAPTNPDSIKNMTNGAIQVLGQGIVAKGTSEPSFGTARPTNTSVLYCIKAKPGISSGGGGGSSITVDDAISDVSTNPVQNKVISAALDLKADASALASKADVSDLATKADVSDLANKADLVSGKVPTSQLPALLSLGETSTTAYAGDKGKTAYDDSQSNKSHIGTLSNLTTTEKSDLVGAINELDAVEPETISLSDFEALSQAEKDNGTPYFVPDAEIVTNFTVMGNRFDKANIYTADERMIGSYLGKPLYQKTINFGALPNNTRKSIEIGNFSIDTVVELYGYAKNNSEEYPLIFAHPTSQYSLALKIEDIDTNTPKVVIITAYDFSAYNGYITCKYTKTSDATVNIGTGNDYSTDEQIIGTWIDGKRLYQKTIEFGALPNNTSKEVNHGISNINYIVNAYGFAKHSTGNAYISIPTCLTNNFIGIYCSNSVIHIETNANNSNYTISYIIIQYTKTTD